MTTATLVRTLLAGPLPQVTVEDPRVLRAFLVASNDPGDTVALAALAGFGARGVGWAFAGGYQAALTRLDPSTTVGGRLAALCATEEGGGHPRDIRTSLARQGDVWTLSGQKKFVTLGADADVLLVVASAGQDMGGRNHLRVARVPAGRRGVSLHAGRPLPFTPEIGHAAVTLDSVELSENELLAGDGYDTVVKPFRTIEDVHVMAALLGWATSTGRRCHWARRWLEEAVAMILLLRTLGAEPPLAPETHAALAGALTGVRRLMDTAAWDSVDGSTRERWERDRPLLDVASSVRAARLETAWSALQVA
jgi:alkylation response protein AidB-like acyl-CoA dehydrogenase